MDTEQNHTHHNDLTVESELTKVKTMLNSWTGQAAPQSITGAIGNVYSISATDTLSLGTNSLGVTGGYTVPTTWTTNGTGNYNWQDLTISPVTMNSNSISVTGENADIVIQGKSLRGWMETVEQRLNILTVNPELEKQWDELKELGDRYRALERQCQEKSEVWKKLKTIPQIKD